jgi:hypothetical protein
MAYGVVTHDRAASFNMGQASSAQVRTSKELHSACFNVRPS